MENTKPFQISKQAVLEAWKCVEKNAGSAGIDRESIEEFESDLKRNLYKIWNRMSSGTYFPPPVMGVPIPKKSGGQRILGIPTVSDRIAQTVVKMVLEPELEKVFLPDSYGYRPNKSAHDAIAITRKRCWQYDWVLEFDIRGLFDNIPWDLLLKAVKHHTSCKWVILYIERWLRAPLQLSDGTTVERTKGTPQGSVVSPILSNLFLHYSFDMWMQRSFPYVPWCRYADDGLLHCSSKEQAEFIKAMIDNRFKECGLELHSEKTKIVHCKKVEQKQENEVKEFIFLGYTFRQRTAKRSSDGLLFNSFMPAVSQIAMKEMRRTIKHGWSLQSKQHWDLESLAKEINPVIRGWIAYYGKFYPSAMCPIYRCIDRRLKIWAKRKFENLSHSDVRGSKWLKHIYKSNPTLFAHWKVRPVY
jgi:RNA-directed DNA polymerase